MKIIEKEGLSKYYSINEYSSATSYRVRKPDLMNIDPVVVGCRLNGILLSIQNPYIFIDKGLKSIKVECGDRMVSKISSKFKFYLSDLETITISVDSASMSPMVILDININRENKPMDIPTSY